MQQLYNRHGEMCTVPVRNERFYTIDNEWWFAIRHGTDQGPYPTQIVARNALIEYINDQLEFEKRLQLDRKQIGSRHYINTDVKYPGLKI